MASVLTPEVILAILGLVSTLITALAGWATKKGAQLIDAKVESEKTAASLLWLNDVVHTVVLALNQTLVVEIRAAAADGEINAAERERLRSVALKSVLAILGEAGTKKVQDALGLDVTAFADYLLQKVEAKVAATKTAA